MMLGIEPGKSGLIPIEGDRRLFHGLGMSQGDFEGEVGFRGGDRRGCRQNDPIIEAFQVKHGVPPVRRSLRGVVIMADLLCSVRAAVRPSLWDRRVAGAAHPAGGIRDVKLKWELAPPGIKSARRNRADHSLRRAIGRPSGGFSEPYWNNVYCKRRAEDDGYAGRVGQPLDSGRGRP